MSGDQEKVEIYYMVNRNNFAWRSIIRYIFKILSVTTVYHDVRSATVTLNETYDENRPGNKAIDENESSWGGVCAVAVNTESSITIEINMTSSVDVTAIEVLSRSDCCGEYTCMILATTQLFVMHDFSSTLCLPWKRKSALMDFTGELLFSTLWPKLNFYVKLSISLVVLVDLRPTI